MTTRKSLPTDLIDSLLADYKKPEDLTGEVSGACSRVISLKEFFHQLVCRIKVT